MQTFVSEQYALETWAMQLFLVFVQTCYVNVDLRYSKNAEITCKHIQNGQKVRPKNT